VRQQDDHSVGRFGASFYVGTDTRFAIKGHTPAGLGRAHEAFDTEGRQVSACRPR